MLERKIDAFRTDSATTDLRRHPRRTVFKSALLYPVLKDATLSITNVSSQGLSGRSALTLGLREQVHVSFNATDFLTAEVRWTNGGQCGLLMEEPLIWLGGHETLMDQLAPADRPRESRLTVDMSATLVTSAPVMVGTIRNLSLEGMMIEANGLREGTRLLVKSRGRGVRMGRVQWSSGGMAGVFFESGT
ncbi:MAG TPA: PilZ domain-containing protein [Sphingobium sp.]|nr:PilZ domain-containing protein [Sphingobium sp.]